MAAFACSIHTHRHSKSILKLQTLNSLLRTKTTIALVVVQAAHALTLLADCAFIAHTQVAYCKHKMGA